MIYSFHMGILQRFDPQKGIVFVVWEGVVTAEEWFGYAQKLVSHPDWADTSRVLGDLLSVKDTSSIQNREIEHATQIFSANPRALRNKKLAVIAGDEFGKARHFEDLLMHFGVSSVVFNNLDTACLFLGVDMLHAYRTLDTMRQELQRE